MTEKQLSYLEAENDWLRVRLAIWEGVKQSEVKSIFDENNQLKRTTQEHKDNLSLAKEKNEKLKLKLDTHLSLTNSERIDYERHLKKLKEENEDLKEDNAILRQALTRLVEAFDDKISDKSPIRDLIK